MQLSLRTKVILFILVIMSIIAAAGGMFNRTFVRRVVVDEYHERSKKIASSVSRAVDPAMVKYIRDEAIKVYDASENKVYSDKWGTPEFDEYIAQYSYIEDTDEYKTLLSLLEGLQEANDVASLYIAYVEPERNIAMYLVDASLKETCPVGCIDHYQEAVRRNQNIEEDGIPTYETNTEPYGWLITTGVPIRLGNETVAYACVDLSMEAMEGVINHYNTAGVIAIVVCLLFTTVLGVALMTILVVNPIKKLSEAASKYRLVDDELGSLENNGFRELNIKTGDEIEVLANSLKKMESDLNDQIENLFATKQELISTREHADIMNEIANRDALTGIRNKRGYETEIQRINKGIAMGNTKVGIVMVDMNDLKKVNDSYGHEKGDKVICSLCDILCSVFKRSPVFRIGGDEFVVIVSNYDYTNLESNVDKFLACIEHNMKENELEPWERASAAIGYAVFDPDKDIAIEDTLKRADDEMYKCKQDMKKKYNVE